MKFILKNFDLETNKYIPGFQKKIDENSIEKILDRIPYKPNQPYPPTLECISLKIQKISADSVEFRFNSNRKLLYESKKNIKIHKINNVQDLLKKDETYFQPFGFFSIFLIILAFMWLFLIPLNIGLIITSSSFQNIIDLQSLLILFMLGFFSLFGGGSFIYSLFKTYPPFDARLPFIDDFQTLDFSNAIMLVFQPFYLNIILNVFPNLMIIEDRIMIYFIIFFIGITVAITELIFYGIEGFKNYRVKYITLDFLFDKINDMESDKLNDILYLYDLIHSIKDKKIFKISFIPKIFGLFALILTLSPVISIVLG